MTTLTPFATFATFAPFAPLFIAVLIEDRDVGHGKNNVRSTRLPGQENSGHAARRRDERAMVLVIKPADAIARLPTAIAPDGSPVAVYLALPAREEAALIARALPPRANVLELGCGTGRVTQWLAEADHRVIAIDQSVDMLRHVMRHPHVTTIQGDIEELQLDWKFDGVILASYLVNTAERLQRVRFLSACRRHVTDVGKVVIQRVDPTSRWIVGAKTFYGPVSVQLLRAIKDGNFINARLEYRVGEQVFQQDVATEILTDSAIVSALGQAELVFERWLDEARTWLVAVPAVPVVPIGRR